MTVRPVQFRLRVPYLRVGYGAGTLAATALGGQFGWTLPFGWFLVSFFLPRPPDAGTLTRVVTWMVQPDHTTQATWTVVALAVAGVGCYARYGNRR